MLTPAGTVADASPYQDHYPVTLPGGEQLILPIQPLPGGREAIALLMANQTPFAVEAAMGALLTRLAGEFRPEVIVGVPTLGLDYARIVARDLGFPEYVALGNSRKFWYDDALSVPVHSVTSPGADKRLYLDPALRIGISNHQCEPSLPITDSHNRPYVEPKLRGRVPCLDYSGRQ